MKALLVANNDTVIENVSTVLKTAGYDIIKYRALLKALDNVEEIDPHLIIISTKEYPRHWKTLAQYATVPLGSYAPQVILYTGGTFSDEDKKKAEALHVRGIFNSVDVDGLDVLREILSLDNDIFSGELTPPPAEIKPIEIPDDFAKKHAHDEKMLSEFVEEEVSHPGVSLEKIGFEIENEVIRASSPMEAAAVTDEELEESDDRLEEIDELEEVSLPNVSELPSEENEAAPEEPVEQALSISIEDILKQNQSFNRFAEIPEIKTEAEAMLSGEKTYEFTDIKGRREDSEDTGKDPMDLWAEIEAEENGIHDDSPEPEPDSKPISISMDELQAVEQTTPVGMSSAPQDEEKPLQISQEELQVARKAIEKDRIGQKEMHTAVKQRFQKVAESAQFVEQDPAHPVTVTQPEVDEVQRRSKLHGSTTFNDEPFVFEEKNEPILSEDTDEEKSVPTVSDILRQNQFSMKNNIDWLAKENADEPEQIDVDDFDIFTDDPTGAEAHDVAEETKDILRQNQFSMKNNIDWLAKENADEPETPDGVFIDDFADPTEMSASERDANLQDILTQNQTKTEATELKTGADELQRMVDKLNIVRSVVCTILLTNPDTGALISGEARNYNRKTLEFIPDIPSFAKNLKNGTKIPQFSLKTDEGIESVSATVISAGEPYILSIDHD
ncbi:MAG: hypothetical protein IJP62_08405 [Treponema sp.]|nr:hypothetical protein [Treponema sp.]